MTTPKLITIGIAVVLTNILLGHFFAPTGIMTTPVVIVLVSGLICHNSDDLEPHLKSLLLFGLISLHDVGIKLFSGGRHDSEGLGWIHLFLFVGLIPSYILLLWNIMTSPGRLLADKLIAVFMFPALMTIHLLVFQDLGLGRYYWYHWNN